MKLFACCIFLASCLSLFAQPKPEIFSLPDVAYPILGMKKSPSSEYLFLTLSGGRFLLYKSGGEKLNSGSHALWKNFSINGFELGGDAEFSSDEKYILVSEQNTAYQGDMARLKPAGIAVLEVSTGSVVYESDNINSAQLLQDNETLLTADNEGVETYNLRTKVKSAKIAIENCEIACLSHSQNILAVSYDPSLEEFKSVEGAGNNKKELKNAARNKKLVAFYEYPSMRRTGVCDQEIDVVFRMQYTADDSYLLFFSRSKQPEHTHLNLYRNIDELRDLNQFQRIDINSLKVDNNNFIWQTSEHLANFDLSSDASLFAFSDNEGLFAAKRKVVVTKFNAQNTIEATYTYQGRPRTRNLFSTAFAFVDDKNILLANGMKLSYWDFRQYPKYVDYIEPVDENALLDNAIGQLDEDLQSESSSLLKAITKKKISGLYIFEITIQKKGEVVSIMACSDDKTNISNQNMLKDILLKYHFDVTIPKNERLKFQYSFNL